MYWLKLIILVIGTTRAITAGRIRKNGLSQSHVLTNSYRNGRPNVLGQHEPRGLLLQALRVYCVFMGEVSQDNVSPMSHLIFVILIMMVRKNCVLLAPIACPSWLPRNLSDTAKLTENCALSETLSNTAKCYRTQQNIIEDTAKHYRTQQNIIKLSETLSNTSKHDRRHSKTLSNSAKHS